VVTLECPIRSYTLTCHDHTLNGQYIQCTLSGDKKICFRRSADGFRDHQMGFVSAG
jgi:hypothetical protein